MWFFLAVLAGLGLGVPILGLVLATIYARTRSAGTPRFAGAANVFWAVVLALFVSPLALCFTTEVDEHTLDAILLLVFAILAFLFGAALYLACFAAKTTRARRIVAACSLALHVGGLVTFGVLAAMRYAEDDVRIWMTLPCTLGSLCALALLRRPEAEPPGPPAT